ncbi:MAG: tetratricopeptide repeat protein [Ignavibacteria bacterium]|nr:tetratricopeptide repeat protein [Ignavibacteria bacterium]
MNINPSEKFIEVICKNRWYDDDGTRKVCIAIFKYPGEESPVILKCRRTFGRALYSIVVYPLANGFFVSRYFLCFYF